MKYKIISTVLDFLIDTTFNLAYAGVITVIGVGIAAALDQHISWQLAYGFTVLVIYLDLLAVNPWRKEKDTSPPSSPVPGTGEARDGT